MLSILLTVRVALIRLVGSEYIVNVASQSTLVNPGDKYVAYCNIPGQGALDIIQNLKLTWFHNGQALASLCEFLSSHLTQKYSCKVLSPQQNNISLELTVLNVQKADAGNLTCDVYEKIKENEQWVRDELVAIKSLAIQVREPIKSMMFRFDANKDEYLTLDNNETLHAMEVLSGKYAPSCEAIGGMPKANVQIMMGDQMMQGRIMDIENKMGTEFVADATDFRGNSQINVTCTAEVEGLPNSEMQLTYRVVVRQRDPKFRCTNTSAAVNNKRHKITCEVYDVDGISCNNILWKRGDTGEDYEPGSYFNINIACTEVTDSKIKTTLEILQVTAEYFKTPFMISVIYNDTLSHTKEFQLIIPEARDPKFRCTNTSAAVNNKRHKITCEVYDIEGISCNNILWKRGDTGEDYMPGSYFNINIACTEVTISKIKTTLEILQVTAEYFKTPFSVIYNDTLSHTKEFQLIIPEARLVRSEYFVNVASQSTWVNPGDNIVAYCNISGLGALDIVYNLEIYWLHNNQPLTSLCEFLSTVLTLKYRCKVLSTRQNNISLELTVSNVQKADAGNLTCEVYEKIKDGDQWIRDELVAIKSLPIQVRGKK
uniref:Ig-like domain-containing protein n=1 Tax=Magallana gigas TaxID=29159 RepID=A0A8W8MCJ1_MAGGI